MPLTYVLHLAVALQSLSFAGTRVLHVGQPKAAALAIAGAPSPRLAASVKASVLDELPAGWRLRGLALGGSAAAALDARADEAEVTTFMPRTLVAGRNVIDVHVAIAGVHVARLKAFAELAESVAAKQVPMIARGQEVMVVVRHGNVLVQAKGTAQQAAGMGERIFVLPISGTHTLQAIVRDASTVEVAL